LDANKLTNSINLLLNEDKFSKYTLDQIFDELGEEDLIEYLKSASLKIIKNIDSKRDMSHFKASVGDTYGDFYIEFKNMQVQPIKESFIVEWFRGEDSEKDGLGIAYEVATGELGVDFIDIEDKNIDKLLKDKLTKVYNKKISKKNRKEYL
jgi:hypothetical protein